MSRIIYWVAGVSSLVLVVVLTIHAGSVGGGPNLWLAAFSYSVFVASIHGLLSHSLPTARKTDNMFYPIIMGIVFGALLAGFVYLILPSFVPPYGSFFKWK